MTRIRQEFETNSVKKHKVKYIKFICLACQKTFWGHPYMIRRKQRCSRCGNFDSIAIAKPKEELK